MSLRPGIIFGTSICVFYVVLSGTLCLHTEDSSAKAGLGSAGTSDVWNADAYQCEDWGEELVNDTILAIQLVKDLQELPRELLDILYADVYENPPKTESFKGNHHTAMKSRNNWWSSLTGKVKARIFNEILKFVHQQQNNPRCYNEIGCFYSHERMAVEVGGPTSPEKIGTKITVFDTPSSSGKEVSYSTWAEQFKKHHYDLQKPLFVITHGFTRDSDMSWMHKLKEALFKYVSCNVLLVEWINGAKFPNYAAAAANSAMPGVFISLLLQEMVKPEQGQLSAQSVHLIGFSLGAHACGFCGRHFRNATGILLGRITGLDPAGPLFEGTNVSLSRKDAAFVDVLHTHSGKFEEYKLSIRQSIGHVDFFPNGGSSQPGCEELWKIGCSHKRAQVYFTESVLSENCHFTSYYCEGGWKNYENCKNQQNTSYIGEMGLHSINKTGRGDQYLKTNRKSPYCIS